MRCKECVLDGVKYPSLVAAARAMGLSVNGVRYRLMTKDERKEYIHKCYDRQVKKGVPPGRYGAEAKVLEPDFDE